MFAGLKFTDRFLNFLKKLDMLLWELFQTNKIPNALI